MGEAGHCLGLVELAALPLDQASELGAWVAWICHGQAFLSGVDGLNANAPQ